MRQNESKLKYREAFRSTKLIDSYFPNHFRSKSLSDSDTEKSNREKINTC